jgi:hypothetical protein
MRRFRFASSTGAHGIVAVGLRTADGDLVLR